MAVAAHVSRVAKDYAPHGYSITQSVTSCGTLPAGGTTAMYIPIVHADDADMYLDGVAFLAVQGHASEGTNYWTISLVGAPLGIGSETAWSSDSVGGASTAITINAVTPFTINNPFLSQGLGLYLKCVPNHASSPQKAFGVVARFRRKA